MKRTVKVVALAMLVAFSVASVAGAKEMENGKNDRKGFFLGFGVGGGMANLSGGGDSQTKAALITDLKIGGGVTENLLLMYNQYTAYTKMSGINYYIFNFPVALQYYVWEDLYVRPAVGLSYLRASTSIGGTTFSADTKVSFGASVAAGYEFRFGKYFALSPEVVYHYDRIRSEVSNGNANVFGAEASLVWFF